MKKFLIILTLLLHANSSLLVARPLEGMDTMKGYSEQAEVEEIDCFLDLVTILQEESEQNGKSGNDQKKHTISFEEAEDMHCPIQLTLLPTIFPTFTFVYLGDMYDPYLTSCSYEIVAPPPEQ